MERPTEKELISHVIEARRVIASLAGEHGTVASKGFMDNTKHIQDLYDAEQMAADTARQPKKPAGSAK